MPRRANITQEKFDDCIMKLQQEGQTPSVQRILDEIGGSLSTIGRMFKAWKESRVVSTEQTSDIPEEVIQSSNELLAKWWHKVQSDTATSIKQIQESTSRQVTEADATQDLYLQELESLESEIKTHSEAYERELKDLKVMHELELEAKNTKLASAEEKIKDLKNEMEENRRQTRTLSEANLALQEKYAELIVKMATKNNISPRLLH